MSVFTNTCTPRKTTILENFLTPDYVSLGLHVCQIIHRLCSGFRAVIGVKSQVKLHAYEWGSPTQFTCYGKFPHKYSFTQWKLVACYLFWI